MTTQEGWTPPAYPVGPGWMGFFDDPERPVVVHFTRDGWGHWRADGIYVAAPALGSDALRSLSIPSYEARANDPTGRALLEQWASLAGERPPELLASGAGLVTAPSAVRRRSARIKVPPGAKPDSFYAKVAETYRRLAGASNRPAVELAEANGVPVTTVHRWVKEARRRGFLAPGQKGRRG